MRVETKIGAEAQGADAEVTARTAPAPTAQTSPPASKGTGSPTTSSTAPEDDPRGLTLRRYRVNNFRSVADSGWLDIDRVTALIGVNESGKTNLLMPLWKLNPASGGAIEPTSDYPKSLFATIRNAPESFQFITAEFETGVEAANLAEIARVTEEECRRISVARLYDGSYQIAFPDYRQRTSDSVIKALASLHNTLGLLQEITAPVGQEELLLAAKSTITRLTRDLDTAQAVTGNDLRLARNSVAALIPEDPPAVSPIIPLLRDLQKALAARMAEMITPDPASNEEVRNAVIARLPKFVYYSNYGNLDSEIYLPHVVENLKRSDLGAKEGAKARTLRVLFEFVGLKAKEVLELGRDFREIREEAEAKMIEEEGKSALIRTLWNRAFGKTPEPDADMLAQIAEAKRTRSILLQSAGTKLTERFADWWKQGDYRFRFEADGNHFRIWVSDARRPQEVELEHRSTGLQWFLSFFLVFLHEAKGAHRNCVLLLDEPGMSLHPLAQRDLSAFFEGLAEANQMIYTTHSPFLVDADRLGRARKVFIGPEGSTRVTGDLMDGGGSDSQRGAAYAVRAAVNIAVAEAGLAGALPVLVPSRIEQTYLSAIKTLTIAAGKFLPQREIVFAPAAGAEVMQAVASILGGVGAADPRVMVDSLPEQAGTAAEGEAPSTGHLVALDVVLGRPDVTVEDLMPSDPMITAVDRVERRPERLFADRFREGTPFVKQVEDWAEAEGIRLEADWRMRVAERMRDRLLVQEGALARREIPDTWVKLLETIAGDAPAA
ncbi:MAG: AAA family ATPase [Rubellimicrobium sp.]|nr:AAA family ATPase [Rubellimicrobium sp.]